MPHRFSRTAMLIGTDGLSTLKNSKIVVFGLGGVGSFVVEGLARAGLGELYLVDYDRVDLTNINRQIHALTGTVGRSKAELMAERVLQINPEAKVHASLERYVPGAGVRLVPPGVDYVVDAIDDVAAKVDLLIHSLELGKRVISAMGAGNKVHPEKLQITDISRTSVCPLARVVRQKLRQRGIRRGLKVIYSTEAPIKPYGEATEDGEVSSGRPKPSPPGSISFVPSVAGLMMAGEVVRDLLAAAQVLPEER